MIILDTNVLSELMKAERSEPVYSWMQALRRQDLFTTAMNQAAILYGLAIMATGRKRESRRAAAAIMFDHHFRGRVLSFDSEAAAAYAEIAAESHRTGRRIDPVDGQIAAIARARKMAVATRNVADFERCGVRTIDPWATP